MSKARKITKKADSLYLKWNKVNSELEELNKKKMELENANKVLVMSTQELEEEMKDLEVLKPVKEFKKMFEEHRALKKELKHLEEGVPSKLGWVLTGAHNAYETRGSKEQILAVKNNMEELNASIENVKNYSQVKRYAARLNNKLKNEALIEANNKKINQLENEYELKNMDKIGYKEQIEKLETPYDVSNEL